MPRRPVLLVFAAAGLMAGGPAFSQSKPPKPLNADPARLSAWSIITHPDGSAPRGKLMYDRFCAACHGGAAGPPPGGPLPGGGPPGPGGPPGGGPMGPGPMGSSAVPSGTAELQVKYGGEIPAELEKRTDLTAETVSYFVRRGVGVMPAIRKTELSDADLRSIGDYLARKR